MFSWFWCIYTMYYIQFIEIPLNIYGQKSMHILTENILYFLCPSQHFLQSNSSDFIGIVGFWSFRVLHDSTRHTNLQKSEFTTASQYFLQVFRMQSKRMIIMCWVCVGQSFCLHILQSQKQVLESMGQQFPGPCQYRQCGSNHCRWLYRSALRVLTCADRQCIRCAYIVFLH